MHGTMIVAGLVLAVSACSGGSEPAVSTRTARAPFEFDPEPSAAFGGHDEGEGMAAYTSDELAGTLSTMSQEELDATAASKALLYGEGVPADYTRDTAWRAALSTPLEGDEDMVLVSVQVPDRPFPWYEFRNNALTLEDREALAAQREADVAPELGDLEARLEGIGAVIQGRYWVAPVVTALVPKGELATIATWTEVYSAARIPPFQTTGGYYTGLETRDAMKGQAMVNAGFTGSQGNKYTSAKVRVGTTDDVPPQWDHYGFKDSSGYNRWWTLQNCTSSCSLSAPGWSNGVAHATTTNMLLGGSIEAGQDAAYTTTTSRRQRSGIAPNVQLGSYWGGGIYAIQQHAILNSVSVMSNPWGWVSDANVNYCNSNHDIGGLNATWRNSADSGVLNVSSAGNEGTNPGCSIRWPGSRHDGITVGALNALNTAVTYPYTDMSAISSRGGGGIRINGTLRSTALAHTDLVVSGTPELFYNYTSGSPGYQLWDHVLYTDGFTSYATPVVAGGVALGISSFYGLGWSGMSTDVRMMIPFFIMLGDGWQKASGTKTISGMDARSGAGRFYDHMMSSAGLTAPWAWSCWKQQIANGETWSYNVGDANPESTSITTMKALMTWDEPDHDAAADLDLYVYNTCPAGGGAAVEVQSDTGYDLRSRLRLTSGIGNNCLQLRVKGFYVPAAKRTFTLCYYVQGGSTVEHLPQKETTP